MTRRPGGGAETCGSCGEEGEGGMRIVEVRLGRAWGEQRGVGAARTRSWRWQLATVHVKAGILLLPLGPAVLEPDLDLGLGQVEAEGEVEPLAHREVAGRLELVLEADQLLVGEGCPRPPRLAASVA